ncbi:MAG: adenylate/guanylate cyclase domain-containing protein [Gammaproteobacteria bacterium]|nr:adenylate/guanylate cyclase domain-containing protein [Gammaproteobacteria bacterium]MCP5200091.1 adenylate/guanylate cyclase domain-containing protein [Gammaproteobacteria bacterium]
MFELNPQSLTGLMLVGTAWAFLRADSRSGTSRALAVGLAAAGAAVFANLVLARLLANGPLPAWAGALVVPEVVAFCAVFEWSLRVRATIPAGQLRTRGGDVALRLAQALVLLYGINGWRQPELRVRDFFGGLSGPGIWSNEVLSLFVAPLTVAMVLWTLSMLLCLNRNPDRAERVRLVAFLVAIPILAVGLVLPLDISPAATVVGVSILLGGALRHAEVRGRQGQFVGRFLSPQVAALVNRHGLRSAVPDERREVSIVSVDLRGFTAFAAARGSDAVIALLRDYYDAVGAAVHEFEGTIKDYAGDGVLVIVGAPLPLPDHAARAVALARRIIEVVTPVTRTHCPDGTLGVGAGVASGAVAVGIVGGQGPLEYAAVGPAVNLAARLGQRARAGEFLVGADTVALLDGDREQLEAREAVSLKGYDAPVAVFGRSLLSVT